MVEVVVVLSIFDVNYGRARGGGEGMGVDDGGVISNQRDLGARNCAVHWYGC